MRWDRELLTHARASIMATMRSLDWSLIIVVAGFAMVAPIGGVTGASVSSPLLWVSRLFGMDRFAAYEAAIAAAAVKRPDYQRKLATIDVGTSSVSVVTFRERRDLPLRDRSFDIWVALRDQVRNACAGAEDPARKLQQILGLPPVAVADNVVTEIDVPRDGLFRPCLGESDIGRPTCDLDLPAAPAANADTATVREAYDQLRFMAKQMWESYRIGFPRPPGSPSDYRYTGYPFTGMGWTYDWAQSRDHFGVSEFVIRRKTAITVVSEKTPTDFCASAK